MERQRSTPIRKPNAKRLWRPPSSQNCAKPKTKWALAQKLDEFGCTPAQAAFCEEYIKDFNGAATVSRLVDRGILAKGKNKNSASASAWFFLNKLNVQNKIKSLLAERKKRFEVSQDAILRQLLVLAYSDIRQAYKGNKLKPVSEMDDETAYCIQEISTGKGKSKIKFYDKNKDIELLAKHLGMFEENVNVNINPEKIQAVIDLNATNAPEPIINHGDAQTTK